MTWLDKIVSDHSDFESPLNFWRWSALCSISAVMRDQVYLDRHIYKVYPNIYVMFHAESGLKKGPPVSMATKLVQYVGNTTVIKGRSSIQAILQELGTAFMGADGKVKSNTSVFISSSEMSSSLVDDPAAAKILTDLYDRNYNEGEWKSLLKSGNTSLNSPTVCMLSATNEAMAGDFVTDEVIRGGYFARTFIIHESKRNKRNSLVLQPSYIPDYKFYAEYLKQLSKLNGAFRYLSVPELKDDYFKYPIIDDHGRQHYMSEVGKIYHDWYDEFCNTVDDQEVKDETGTLNRFGDSVLKVAMLLSLAEHPVLEITPDAMNEAIRICEQLLGNVRKTTAGKNGIANNSNLKSLIIHELLQRDNHSISRQMLTKRFYLHYNTVEELNDVMESFQVAKLITAKGDGNGTIYTMPEEQVAEIKEFMAGKGNRREKERRVN